MYIWVNGQVRNKILLSRSRQVNLTILCDGAQHPLEDIIVDNNMQETEGVEVAKEDQRKNRCCYKQLGKCVCACDRDIKLYGFSDYLFACTYHNIHSLQSKNVHIRVCLFRRFVPTEWTRKYIRCLQHPHTHKTGTMTHMHTHTYCFMG